MPRDISELSDPVFQYGAFRAVTGSAQGAAQRVLRDYTRLEWGEAGEVCPGEGPAKLSPEECASGM